MERGLAHILAGHGEANVEIAQPDLVVT